MIRRRSRVRGRRAGRSTMELRRRATVIALVAGSLAGPGLVAVSTTPVAAATPAPRFTPGLPLLDANGTNTGGSEPSIRVDGGGHVYVTAPVGVPTGGCPIWRVHPDALNKNKLPYEYLGKFDTD